MSLISRRLPQRHAEEHVARDAIDGFESRAIRDPECAVASLLRGLHVIAAQ